MVSSLPSPAHEIEKYSSTRIKITVLLFRFINTLFSHDFLWFTFHSEFFDSTYFYLWRPSYISTVFHIFLVKRHFNSQHVTYTSCFTGTLHVCFFSTMFYLWLPPYIYRSCTLPYIYYTVYSSQLFPYNSERPGPFQANYYASIFLTGIYILRSN